jgi:hypothetical protein
LFGVGQVALLPPRPENRGRPKFKTHEAFVNWLGSSYPEDISNTAKGASFRDALLPACYLKRHEDDASAA